MPQQALRLFLFCITNPRGRWLEAERRRCSIPDWQVRLAVPSLDWLVAERLHTDLAGPILLVVVLVQRHMGLV